tara:strand:- start:10029 stop:10343 length:315 start_codon:yes stop_codon:yes gene_type:complete
MANFESSDDLTNFFITDDFAVSATYTVQGGSASTIKGVFDKEFIEIDTDGGVDVASNDPRFTCKTSDVTNASNGDTIVIDSVTYKVRIAEADGTGITILVLEKQ